LVDIEENLDVVLTLRVAETLQGSEADSWVVTWRALSVVVPPHSLAGAAAHYRDDIVIGFTPDASAYDGGCCGSGSAVASGRCGGSPAASPCAETSPNWRRCWARRA